MSEVSVTLSPGQLLRVATGYMYAGREAYVDLPYEDVLKLIAKPDGRKRERVKTPEAKLSRTVCLMVRAIESGKWATGAPIDQLVMTGKLIALVNNMTLNEAASLSPKAQAAIDNLIDGKLSGTEHGRNLAQAFRGRS